MVSLERAGFLSRSCGGSNAARVATTVKRPSSQKGKAAVYSNSYKKHYNQMAEKCIVPGADKTALSRSGAGMKILLWDSQMFPWIFKSLKRQPLIMDTNGLTSSNLTERSICLLLNCQGTYLHLHPAFQVLLLVDCRLWGISPHELSQAHLGKPREAQILCSTHVWHSTLLVEGCRAVDFSIDVNRKNHARWSMFSRYRNCSTPWFLLELWQIEIWASSMTTA